MILSIQELARHKMTALSAALSTPVTPSTRYWWLAPLRLRGTALPPNLVLAARLLTLCFIGTGQILHLSSHFLPFVSFFDRLGSPAVFHWTLTGTFLFGAAVLFFTRWSRPACLLLSAVLFVSLLSSRMYFENNRTFCACILLLIGLSSANRKPWLVRLQVALVYFGAALNKLLDPDWRSGQFFAFWFGKIHNPELWDKVTQLVPPMGLAQLMDWTVIGLELVLVIGFLVPRFYSWAIWLGICYHTALMVVMNSTFGMFYYAMLISYLAFVEWPKPGALVFYDGDCGFCDATRRWFVRSDPERGFNWVPLQSAVNRYGISTELLAEKLHLILCGKTFRGFSAFKVLVLYNPLMYMLFASIACLQPRVPGYRWLAIAVIAIFSAPMRPIGESAYDWISRHRHAISPVACQVASPPEGA